jgi:glycosyltransferase involved in cell wall biosynthesis
MKILVSAYACSPSRGSEPGVGWHFVKAMAAYHDLWVITEESEFRAGIEAELRRDADLARRVHFRFVRRSRHPLLWRLWPPAYYWSYRAWQRKALELARDLHREVGFDLAHQLNLVGFREPGYLWQLGVPFVWGPVGGTQNVPWRFLGELGLYGAMYHLCRNVVNHLHVGLLRRPRLAAAAAGRGLIAATQETRRAFLGRWGADSTVISEVGAAGPGDRAATERLAREPLRIAWSGQHKPAKALPLLLGALAQLPATLPWRLDVLGDGPCTMKWRRMASRLGIGGGCRWHGWLDRGAAMSVVARAHVFVITSLKDLTSTVLLEALSAGVPVVALDHCGFAEVVTAECGIKIPLASPRQVKNDLADALVKLADNEPLRRRLARGAAGRATDFNWQSKAEALNDVYERVGGVVRHATPASLVGCQS